MNIMSWLVMELMAQQALREHELRSQHVAAGWHEPRDGRGGRHATVGASARGGVVAVLSSCATIVQPDSEAAE